MAEDSFRFELAEWTAFLLLNSFAGKHAKHISARTHADLSHVNEKTVEDQAISANITILAIIAIIAIITTIIADITIITVINLHSRSLSSRNSPRLHEGCGFQGNPGKALLGSVKVSNDSGSFWAMFTIRIVLYLEVRWGELFSNTCVAFERRGHVPYRSKLRQGCGMYGLQLDEASLWQRRVGDLSGVAAWPNTSQTLENQSPACPC